MNKEHRDKLIRELVQNFRQGLFGGSGFVGLAALEAARIEEILKELFDDCSN